MNKRLWARVGVTFHISDKKYKEFSQLAEKNDTEAVAQLIKQWFSDGLAQLDGETYFPNHDDCCENPNEDDFDNIYL